jgi:heme exporter protein CcmD
MTALSEILGRHGGYILASYVATLLIMAALIWQTISRYRAARRQMIERAGPDHG